VDMREINKAVINEFRANQGKLSGPMEGAPVLLLTTTGRTSGNTHTTPVGFVDAEGRLAVAAANGGSEHHPDWYRNIENNDQVTIEVPGASIPSVATITSGVERSELLQQLTKSLPGMADHVAATTREIPVVIFNQAE
jgi:deazaflavin-dependent oxidoreductase (nitroreductase family)